MKALKRLVWGLVFFVLAGRMAFAQSPSAAEKIISRLPERTFGFMATSGMEQLRPAFDQSSIGQLWNNPNIQNFYIQIRDLVVAAIRKDMTASAMSEEDESLKLIPKLAAEVIQCPIAFGIVECPVENAHAMPFGIMILVEADKRKETIVPLIEQIERQAGKDRISDKTVGGMSFHGATDADGIPSVWGWHRDYFVMMVNYAGQDWFKGLDNPSSKSGPLAGLPNHGDLFVMHFDMQKFYEMFSRLIESDGGKEGLDKFHAIMDILGLSKVQPISARLGFSGKDLVVDEWIRIPAPQTGIFTAVKSVDRKSFGRTDARSMATAAWNVDIGILYDVIIKAFETGMDNEQGRLEIHKAIADFEAKAGIQIRHGLLASLDGSMIVQAFPSMVIQEAPAGGVALVVGLKDAVLFEQQVKALIDRFGKDLKPDVLQIRSGKLESGQTQTFLINTTLSMVQIVPNWVVADNRLILTTNPNITTILLKQYSEKPAFAPFADDKTFQSLTATMPSKLAYVEYNDTAVSTGQLYQLLRQFWPMVIGMASGQGLTLPATLPDIQEQLNGLGKSLFYSYLDKDGYHMHYQGSGLETGSVAGGAIVLSVILPALAKANDQDKQAITLANLKGIGQVCIGYADDHEGEFPPNLNTLVKDGHLTDKILVSPRKPKDYSGPSYIYIPGQKTSNPGENVLAFEAPTFTKDGMVNVLFLDGRVEAMEVGKVLAAVKKTYEQLGRPMPEESNLAEPKIDKLAPVKPNPQGKRDTVPKSQNKPVTRNRNML